MYRALPAAQGITNATGASGNANNSQRTLADNSSSSANQIASDLAQQLNISAAVPNTRLSAARDTQRKRVVDIVARFKSLREGSRLLSEQLDVSNNNHDLLPTVDLQRQGYEDLLKSLRELPVNLRETSFRPGTLRSIIYQIEKLLSIEVPLRRIIWEAGSTQTHIDNVGYLQLIENLKPFIAATHKRIDNLIDLYDNSDKGETQFLFTAASDTFATLYQACSRIMLYLDIDAAEIDADQTTQHNKSLGDVRHYLKQFAALVLENSPLISKTPTDDGVYCRIDKSSFDLYANKLPLIAQMKDVSLAGLLCIIEMKPVNHDGSPSQARQDAQQKAISHFELLLDLCEKCEQIVKKVCVAEHWADLLERSPTHSQLVQNKLQQQFFTAIQNEACAVADHEEQVDTDTTAKVENQATEVSKRIHGLLRKAEKLLNAKPLAILAATRKNPGIYSPEFIHHVRQTFCKVALENCEAITQLVEKIQTEINRDNCSETLNDQLGETRNSLSAKVDHLQKEIEYSSSERFVLHTLKSYSIPKEKYWRQLLEKEQIDSIDLIRNPDTDTLNDRLYQFKLCPVAQDGTDYEPTWLHVHLKKEIHVPRQWQALEQSDVSAAHLKSNVNHHRGANWQEDQRRKGNHAAVVQRSPVSLDFVKEVAKRLEPVKMEKSKSKSRGKRK